jgi:hypothetical protein
MTVVSCELKRQGQKQPHNSKMIRQYNGKNKAIRQNNGSWETKNWA